MGHRERMEREGDWLGLARWHARRGELREAHEASVCAGVPVIYQASSQYGVCHPGRIHHLIMHDTPRMVAPVPFECHWDLFTARLWLADCAEHVCESFLALPGGGCDESFVRKVEDCVHFAKWPQREPVIDHMVRNVRPFNFHWGGVRGSWSSRALPGFMWSLSHLVDDVGLAKQPIHQLAMWLRELIPPGYTAIRRAESAWQCERLFSYLFGERGQEGTIASRQDPS